MNGLGRSVSVAGDGVVVADSEMASRGYGSAIPTKIQVRKSIWELARSFYFLSHFSFSLLNHEFYDPTFRRRSHISHSCLLYPYSCFMSISTPKVHMYSISRP